MPGHEKLVCPSYKCVTGANLLGIVKDDGNVAFLDKPLPVDQEFVQIARSGRPPELRFRFSHSCAEGVCANWAGDHCGLIETLTRDTTAGASLLPACAIRSECRWFAERGGVACRVCPNVVRGAEQVD